MKTNIGGLEKTVRSLIALPILSFGYYLRPENVYLSQVIFWSGMFLAFTAAFTWCPVHHTLGTSTHKVKTDSLSRESPSATS